MAGKAKTRDEARSNRIKIAAMLNAGNTYRQIYQETGADTHTIGKVKKMLDDPQRSPDDDRRDQNGRENHYTAETKQAILDMRNETGFGSRLIWALLKRQPEKYGITDPDQIPSTETIHKLLVEHGLTQKMVGAKDKRGFPIDFEDKPGVIALDEWGAVHVRGERIFLVTCQDRFTKLSFGVPVFKKGSAQTWIRAQQIARSHLLNGAAPTAIWIDNGIGMALASGSTPQPVRYALSQGTRVVYNAPHQPWRNGRLENWHWRQEIEYWSKLDPSTGAKAAIQGFLDYVNWYNVERPHGGLHDFEGQKIVNKSPADLANWYLPIQLADVAQREAPEQRLEPQKGIIDMVRMVRNNGRIELQGSDELKVSEIFAGAWLRIRFFCDPAQPTQIGQVIWQRGQKKEPLIVGTFNHLIDRTRKRGQPLVTDMRDVDFSDLPDAEYITGSKIDEYQADRAASRIGKRAKNTHTNRAASEAGRDIDPETGEIFQALD